MIQLRFLATPDRWVGEACTMCSAYVKILGIRYSQGDHGMSHFVDITTAGKDQGDELKRRLKAMKEVVNVDVTELEPNHLLGVVTSKNCVVCPAIADVDASCFISSAATEEDCSVGYKVLLSRENVPVIINRLSKTGAEYKVAEISTVSSLPGLTSRQERILKTAMELGFYDFPRKVTNEELAAKLGVKPSTLSEIVRRAERKVVGKYFESQQ
jgi:predicted DNA binding protein